MMEVSRWAFSHAILSKDIMFTGIVQGTAEVVAIDEKENFRTHVLRLPAQLLPGLELGASVAHNGCCLTVTRIEGDKVSFDLMRETLKLTNLGLLKVGDRVNVERAAKFGDEIGGHAMSGHIMTTAEVTEVIVSPNNRQVWFRIAPELARYVFTKGYIGIDGISLTIGEVKGDTFCVNLIPETLERTIIADRKAGDLINIEIDPQTQAIVDTVERVKAQQQKP
jgi:riboflavin synthase